MKKLLSVFAAAAMLFGFASCSGDLHDVNQDPFAATKSVFLVGGIGDSVVDSSQYLSKDVSGLGKDQKGYEVPLKDGKFSVEFTYTGADGWSAGAGKHAFTIMSNVDAGWNEAIARWGNGKIEVGKEGAIEISSSNIILEGLEAGTKYTLKGSLTAAGGTISLEKGLSGVSMDIINVKDGLMKDAVSATAKSSGDDYVYTYFINAEKAGSMSFVVRLGTNVWVPTSEANLANANCKVAAPSRFDTVAKVEYPFTFEYDAWSYGYEMTLTYKTTDGSLDVKAEKLSGMYIASNITNGAWAAMTPENEEKTSWSIIGTGAQLNPGWDPVYGINTSRSYNDDTYRALKDGSTNIASFGTAVNMSKQSKDGDKDKSVKISAPLVADKNYKLIFTVLDDGKGTIKLVEAE